MAAPKLSKLEFQIMETLWAQGECSIREIQDAFPVKRKPAYTTVQTTVYRLETKDVVRRVKKVGNFHIFAASISRNAAQRRLIDELLGFFGGSSQALIAHLVEAGKLSADDIKESERALKEFSAKEKRS